MVVPGHEPVLGDDLLAGGVLRVAEPVPDHLEHQVEGAQREHVHHQAEVAFGVHEAVAAPAQVVGEGPEAFGLALAQPAQHGVQLVDGLARQDGVQELHRAHHRGGVGEVVGARIAEDVGDLGLLEQHRVHADAVPGVFECHHDRKREALVDDASHEIGACALEEMGVDEFQALETARVHPEPVGVVEDFGGHAMRVADGVPVRLAEPEVPQHPPEAGLHLMPARVAALGQRFQPFVRRRRDEFEQAVGAHRAEGAPADGVEEGLHEAGVGHVLEPRAVEVAHLPPALAPVRRGVEFPAQLVLYGQAPLVVELHALADVLDLALPVALLEAPPRAVGDAPELPVVTLEPFVDEPRTARDVRPPARHRAAHISPTMMRPNSEQDTRWAPSISRAKS